MGKPQRIGKENDEKKEIKPVLSSAVEQAIQPLLQVINDRVPGQWFTEEQERSLLQILAMLDGNIHRTSKATGLGLGVIWRIKERNMAAFSEERERWKRQHALRAADVADLALEKMVEGIAEGDISPRDAAVTWGILVQRGMDLAGEGATVTHKVIQSVDVAALDAAMERLKAIQATRTEAQGETLDADFRVIE